MAQFVGTVTLKGRKRRVEVSGDPRKMVVQVDGRAVYDKTPFVARDKVTFEAEGETVTLTWRYPGLTRLECDITAAGETTTLSGVVADTGELVAPLDAATRHRLYVRTGGCVFVGAGLLALGLTYDSLQRGSYYDVDVLRAVPALILGGAAAALFPGGATRSGRAVKWAAFAAGLLLVGLGLLFARWFVVTFGP